MPKKNTEKIEIKKLSPLKEKYLSTNLNNKKLTSEEKLDLLNKKIDYLNINLGKNKQKIPRQNSSESKNKIKNLRPGSIKGPWSEEENKLLIEWVRKNGHKRWKKCEKIIPGRTSKQCREHWKNCLNPDLIKGFWSSEEDFLIMYFYEKCGGSWKKMINLFNGRTENSIKNRFFSQLRKIASCNLSSTEKRLSHKKKLDELLNYLNIAIENSRKRYLKEKPQNEEDFNKYLFEMEKKIKHKKNKILNDEENNINDTILSTNLSNLENSQNILNKKDKTKSFFCLNRKRTLNIPKEINILDKKGNNSKIEETNYIRENINNINEEYLKNKEENVNENPNLNIESENLKTNINQNENYLKERNDNFKYQKENNPENENNEINNFDLLNKNESINNFTNNNINQKYTIYEVFPPNSLFNNYLYNNNNIYNNSYYSPQGINYFNRSDSFSDIQNRLLYNTYNFIKKPSFNSIEGNQEINNDIENPLYFNLKHF